MSELWHAANYGQLEQVIRLSADYIGNRDVISEALVQSCKEGHIELVRWFVEHTAADVNYALTWTSLTAACEFGHEEVVKFLLSLSDIEVNQCDSNFGAGISPLLMACYHDRKSVAMCLLRDARNNLDVNFFDRNGNTPLHYVVWRCENDGITQLHKACLTENLIYVQTIKSNLLAPIINAQNNAGNTALHLASNLGHVDIVKILMSEGADETITNDDRMTPAQVAARNNHVSWLCEELLIWLDRVRPITEKFRREKIKMLKVAFVVMLTFVRKKKNKIEDSDEDIDLLDFLTP